MCQLNTRSCARWSPQLAISRASKLGRGHVLNIRGESFRLREKRQAGLFPSQQHLAASPEEAGDNYRH